MTRLIDADSLFEKVGNIKPNNKSEYELLGKFMNMITDSPTVAPKHGEWEDCGGIFCARCSVCKEVAYETAGNFCPNCGADMRGDSE